MRAFHAFCTWLARRRKGFEVPEFEWPKVPEYQPTIISSETQDAILQAIPEDRRGVFLAMARLGLRPGEAVALEASDYSGGWLTVRRALKGRNLGAPIRSTKNNRCERLPIPADLEAWVEKHVPKERRLQGLTLFINPKASNRDLRWTPTSIRRTWEKACTLAAGSR